MAARVAAAAPASEPWKEHLLRTDRMPAVELLIAAKQAIEALLEPCRKKRYQVQLRHYSELLFPTVSRQGRHHSPAAANSFMLVLHRS